MLRSKINKHATLCQRNLLTKRKYSYLILVDRTVAVGIRSSTGCSGYLEVSGGRLNLRQPMQGGGLRIRKAQDPGLHCESATREDRAFKIYVCEAANVTANMSMKTDLSVQELINGFPCEHLLNPLTPAYLRLFVLVQNIRTRPSLDQSLCPPIERKNLKDQNQPMRVGEIDFPD